MTLYHLYIIRGHLVDRDFDDYSIQLVQADLVSIEAEVLRFDLELARLITPDSGTSSVWLWKHVSMG